MFTNFRSLNSELEQAMYGLPEADDDDDDDDDTTTTTTTTTTNNNNNNNNNGGRSQWPSNLGHVLSSAT
jgi:hypothetical protein